MLTCLAIRRSCCLVAHAGGEPPDTGKKELMCPGAPPHSHPSHQSVVRGDGGGSAPYVLVKLLCKQNVVMFVCDVLFRVVVYYCSV